MIRLAIAGATGRMGRCVLDLASRDDRFDIAAALTAPGGGEAGSTIRVGDRDIPVVESLDVRCDVLVDFTVADGTLAWLTVCRRLGMAMLIGATGHHDEQLARIREAARRIPIVKAANCSVGVQAMLRVVERLAADLGDGYDVEIVETHHRRKVDSPSGTALTLLEAIARARGGSPTDRVVFGRHGPTGERPRGQIGVHAVRMGEAVSQHEIHFSGSGETITIRHAAHTRETFASGALRAAAWLVGRDPGLYTMRDVLG